MTFWLIAYWLKVSEPHLSTPATLGIMMGTMFILFFWGIGAGWRPRTRRGRAQLPTLWQGISPGSLERIVATARSIGRSTYVPHRDLGIGLHHIPGASGFPSRAPGAGG